MRPAIEIGKWLAAMKVRTVSLSLRFIIIGPWTQLWSHRGPKGYAMLMSPNGCPWSPLLGWYCCPQRKVLAIPQSLVRCASCREVSEQKRGTRVKDSAKNCASKRRKRAGRGWGRKEGNFLPVPLPPLYFSALALFLARSKQEIPFLCH